MRFSEICLTRKELRILKRARKTPVPENGVERLKKFDLLSYDMIGIPGRMPVRCGFASITDTGVDYLHYIKSKRREKRWENIRYAITTAIALAALIKSFFF